MTDLIRGLHHVTATVDKAQDDVDFYGRDLGLRVVKKTVNFDNHDVYHFYYGNEAGTPGTLFTTFPYANQGVREGVRGAGQVHVTTFSVPTESLPTWKTRLSGMRVDEPEPRFGEPSLVVSDPSGLHIELRGDDRDQRPPWITDDVDPRHAIRGLHSVTLYVHSAEPTVSFLKDVMGFEVIRESVRGIRLAVGEDQPGRLVDVVPVPDEAAAVNGLGTVHHVAFAVDNEDDQLVMRERLVRGGYEVTKVYDRQYFRSIYFREPGGVLYEIATIPPGFTVDEPISDLGRSLKLPPWEEPHRSAIEANLARVAY